ncbi:hypothetical protein ACFVUS_28480 [Nocardia sp. NPDC058058]|uniref:hypothetical protein n=1 Tax=Nocardia sp. NPDC058058 TaxID=3346317 RepID=UPI0036DE8A20
MSVNIGVCFSVYDLKVEDAEVIYKLFEKVVKETQLEPEVIIALRDNDDGTRDVRVVSEQLVVFSRFYEWRPTFEESLQRQVTEAVQSAKVSFEWHYAEED